MSIKLRFLVFKADNCSICHAMDQKRTIEDFVSANAPGIDSAFSWAGDAIRRLSCADKDGETPDHTDYERSFNLSDDYSVTMFPTVILEARMPDGSGLELTRTEGGVPTKSFAKAFGEALENVGALANILDAEEGRSQLEASKDLPW